MASEDYNVQLDAQITYQAYEVLPPPDITNITGTVTGGAITTVTGDAGAGASGPTLFTSGGTTGLTFTAAGASDTLSGTLAVAHGGTGAVTAAAARTNLAVPLIHTAAVAPAVTDDGASGFPVGSLWVDTVLQDGYMSTDSSSGAAVWKKITP